MRISHLTVSLGAIAAALTFTPAFAQDAAPAATGDTALTYEERIARLEQELDTLKRQRELDQEITTATAAKTPVATLDKKGLSFTSADGKYAFGINAQVNVDVHSFSNDGGTLRDEVVGRLIRPTFSGKAGNASFRFTPELGGSSSAAASIVDAYIEYKVSDAVQFRGGKFKSPLGLERLQSDADVIWTERGHSTNLVPNRDVGYQVFGTLFDSVVEYQVGLFNGATDGVNLNNDLDNQKDVVYRVFAQPFLNSSVVFLQGFGIGYAGSDGKHLGNATDTQLGSYKTPGQQTFFKYGAGVYSNGKETRSNPQAWFYLNNIGILADYVTVKQNVASATAAAELENKALDVSASWVLTGESVSYKGGVKPAKPFNPKNGTLGAFELTARYGYTEIDKNAFTSGFASAASAAQKATSTGLGLGWYWSENLKLVADYDSTEFDGGAAAGADRRKEAFASGRIQFRY
ncbi:OprO/OprP family phosphate-selective porin [Asticcacaulis sp.]|uniref:OprO/OprP family phosphate-selective porin n=1 Tax=Asticcacaulis sp. TaxID=1872648 RepID=UPI002CE4DFEA|nr:porin [Asticcacaulis sp.]HTM81998.1 porin [Asticcacaulis sp.]